MLPLVSPTGASGRRRVAAALPGADVTESWPRALTVTLQVGRYTVTEILRILVANTVKQFGC